MSIEVSMLYKLRFQQQAKILATEVSNNGPAGIADILAIKNDKVYEYEIKRSKTDFRNDFNKSSFGVQKHILYNDKEALQKINLPYKNYAHLKHFVPDFFYFVVPEELGEFALAYLKEHKYNKYGLITVSKKRIDWLIRSSTCVRRAKQLDSQANIQRAKERITARLSSEMINAKMDYWRKVLEEEL